MLRRARVPMPEVRTRPRGGLLLKAPAEGALRVLARTAVDAVLYVFLAALWANHFLGTVLEILGRWVCGEGSSVEAAGLVVRACSKFVMVLLGPAYIMLVITRVRKHAEFDLKEQEKERREKEKLAASNNLTVVETVNEQLPKRKAVPRPRIPKGVKLAPLYGYLPMFLLLFIAITMQLHHEQGSLMWRVADVLFDIARLGIAVILGVWGVPNLVILVTIPKAKDEDDKVQ